MTHPLLHAVDRSYDPADLVQLELLFDEVWASVTADGDIPDNSLVGEQHRLATIILSLAADGQFGELQIARIAGRLMREGQSVPAGRR